MADFIPRYVAEPLRRFSDYHHDSIRLLHMCMRGISMQMALPQTVSALRQYEALHPNREFESEEEHAKKLKDAQAAAAFAEKEIKEGFPILNAHVLVGLWGALESGVEDSLVGALLNEPALLRVEPFAKVRVPLAEFESLERDERIRLLLQEVKRGQSTDRPQGIDGLERLLGYMNLSGEVDPEIKKTLWEMQNLRNVIVHRGSIVDRRLLKNCPCLKFEIGAALKVLHDDIHRYDHALHQYLREIVERLGRKYEVDLTQYSEG
jgi:hypothetical protein